MHRMHTAVGELEQRCERRHERAAEKCLVERAGEITRDAWLDDITAGAAPERLVHIFVRVMHAQEDGRCCREPGLLERPKRLKPVESWHLDVEDNDVRIHLGGK